MQRIPEPELMNDALQAQAYAQADFSEPHTHFVSLFAEKFPALGVTGNVLDLGCGPADVTRRFAQAYPACRLHGIDGAPNMLALGREMNTQASLAQRIDLFELPLPCPALPLAQYDIVISNSLLHHLHDPLVLWHSLQQFAAPGAPVFIMDLRRPPTVQVAQALVTNYAETEPAVLREDFLASLCAAFTPEEIEAQLTAVQLHNLKVEIVSDRHLIVFGYMP
jgi:trans-aconitate methyltransferase